jgi:hypothetical protein
MAATLAMALFAPAVASGQDTQPESSYPHRVGYVNDLAGVVDQESRNAMEDIASEVRRKSKGDIVVVTLPRLEGKPLEEIADELTKLWNVGYRGAPDDPANDTGVLIMLSLEEREFSIQVQEGVEAFFPSAAIRDRASTAQACWRRCGALVRCSPSGSSSSWKTGNSANGEWPGGQSPGDTHGGRAPSRGTRPRRRARAVLSVRDST